MGTRSALGTIDNIGHKVSAITIDPSKKTNAIKKEILQQQQIVTRQKLCKAKATSSLKDLVETEPKSVSGMHHRLNFFSNQLHLNFWKNLMQIKISNLVQQEPSIEAVKNVTKTDILLGHPESMDISEDKPEAFSKALLKVEDIDENDKDNPQLVSEYVNDIYQYMKELEVGFQYVVFSLVCFLHTIKKNCICTFRLNVIIFKNLKWSLLLKCIFRISSFKVHILIFISEKISSETKVPRGIRNNRENASYFDWLVVPSSSQISPVTRNPLPNCFHHWPFSSGILDFIFMNKCKACVVNAKLSDFNTNYYCHIKKMTFLIFKLV